MPVIPPTANPPTVGVGSVSYQADVVPAFDGVTATYTVSLYRSVRGGVCGPYSEATTCTSMYEVVTTLLGWGYLLAAPFGEVCPNGYASAPLLRFQP